MIRYISANITTGQPIAFGVSDEEALFVQLCEYLHGSGFLFDDASNKEISAGQEVIQAFFDQEEALMDHLIEKERLDKFINYIKSRKWSNEEMLEKSRMKVVKMFDQMAQGTYHSFNIRRNIHIGILQFYQHPLHDFLLYLTAYKSFFSQGEEDNPSTDQAFSVEDLIKLRKNIVERLEGRKFVDMLLNDISTQPGGYPLEEIKEVRNSETPIEIFFIRPSQQSTMPNSQAGASNSPQQSAQSSDSTGKSTGSNPKLKSSSGKSSKKLEIEEDEVMDDLNFEEASSVDDDESDVIYGSGKITKDSCLNFIQKYPDSALKFIFRRDITEKVLPKDVKSIYKEWENRGLKRGNVRGIILEMMGWEKLPDNLTILEISLELKERVYDLLG